jgi:hypothetical protein
MALPGFEPEFTSEKANWADLLPIIRIQVDRMYARLACPQNPFIWRAEIFQWPRPSYLARQRKAFIGELLCTCCVAGRRTPRGRESKRMAALVTE